MRLELASLTVALVALAASARAQPAPGVVGTESLQTLEVGKPVAFVPAARPATVVCDDLTVVSVADAGAYLRVTGLKPGATDCSFGSLLAPGQRAIYRFVVVP